jgi:hypothetical protein
MSILNRMPGRRAFLFAFASFAFMVAIGSTSTAQNETAAPAQPTANVGSGGETYVEFLIGDLSWPERKWGHVSLRVVGPGSIDKIFDFGRYGKMWGIKGGSEGEPILRIWKAGTFEKYRAYHHRDGGITKRIRFESEEWRNKRILAYYERMIKGARRVSGGDIVGYNTQVNYPTFHAVDVNCTTVSINAFMEGFAYQVNSIRYARGRDLYGWAVGTARERSYNSRTDRWNHIWWPLDLLDLLEEQFVAKGLATESTL